MSLHLGVFRPVYVPSFGSVPSNICRFTYKVILPEVFILRITSYSFVLPCTLWLRLGLCSFLNGGAVFLTFLYFHTNSWGPGPGRVMTSVCALFYLWFAFVLVGL